MAKGRIHVANAASKEVGKRVRSLRTSLSLTQKELGKKAVLSPNHISNIENGVENVSDDAIARLSAALSTTFEFLKNGDVASKARFDKKLEKLMKPKRTQIPGQMSIFDFGM